MAGGGKTFTDDDLWASEGKMQLLQSKMDKGESLNLTEQAMDLAASNGHVEVVKWLHSLEDVKCTTRAMDGAAENGHLGVVQWLHATRQEGCTSSALTEAAGNGHLDIVKWLITNKVAGDTSAALKLASERGHYDVIEYLTSSAGGQNKKQCIREDGDDTSGSDSRIGDGSTEEFSSMQAPQPRSASADSAADTPVGMFGSPFERSPTQSGIKLPQKASADLEASKEMVDPPAEKSASQEKPSANHTGVQQQRQQNLWTHLMRSPDLAMTAAGGLTAREERQIRAVMEFRKAYGLQALEGTQIPEDPFTLFAVWFEESRIARVSEPGAMCLSTVGPTGRPSARYVMLQGFDQRGFAWYTNFESRKSQEIAHNPYGALSFWWSELQRAVRIEGVIAKVSEKESTDYFKSRPRGSQVGAWALHQSRPVESRSSLERNVKDVQENFLTLAEVPRPQHFGGYRLRPDRIEFWKGRQSRIHDRIVYVVVNGAWQVQRLQP